jgi:peptide/nickel transport system substrate-binding protein
MPISSPLLVTFVALLTATACRATAAPTGTVLRIVPQADLTNLDPISTTNYVTRNHGYLVYDTLFGTDATGHIAPQMVESYTVTTDQKVWTFILREGLEFHDGTPVTSADVIASLQRWCERDTMGQRLRTFVARWDAVDSKTFRLTLKSPYGLVRESLGKPDSNVPFIMPRRIAQTPASSQITDATGSGPFIFKKDEWRPGEKAVYVRNPRYKPRQEPPSGTAGGKVARVDRIEWIVLKDPQTQVSALAAGDVDMIAYPIAEQYAALKRATGVQLFDAVPFLAQFDLIFNHQTPPFDNPRIRLAAMAALNQPAFLQTQVGNPDLYRVCLSVYSCDSPYVTSAGMDLLAHPNPAHARQMLKESGYRSEPIVLMAPTDLAVIAKLPGVAASLLREAGFVVDVQSMDWNSVLSRRTRPTGWNMLLLAWNATSAMNPVVSQLLSGAGYPNAYIGWPTDARLEELRSAFAVAPNEAERKRIAVEVQIRAMEIAAFVPLGEYKTVVAARTNVRGLVPGFFPVPWNLEKH